MPGLNGVDRVQPRQRQVAYKLSETQSTLQISAITIPATLKPQIPPFAYGKLRNGGVREPQSLSTSPNHSFLIESDNPSLRLQRLIVLNNLPGNISAENINKWFNMYTGPQGIRIELIVITSGQCTYGSPLRSTMYIICQGYSDTCQLRLLLYNNDFFGIRTEESDKPERYDRGITGWEVQDLANSYFPTSIERIVTNAPLGEMRFDSSTLGT